jgi:hypothetical protein
VNFDGILSVVGASGNMYPTYLAKVNQRMAIPSNFTLAVNGFNAGLDYTVIISMEMVEPYAGTNLVLQFTVTESHIPENWGGLTEVNHVNRLMVPGANGTPLDFSSQTTQSVMLNFSLNAGWDFENIDFVAFIQNNSGKEILQGFTVHAADLMPMYYNNAGCMAIHMVPVTNCSGEVAPRVNLINEGAEDLTSVNINYKINNEGVNTFLWNGILGYGESAQVDLPPASFSLQANNDLLIYTSNPNGNPDEDTSNDSTAMAFVSAMEVVPNVYIFIKLDDNPDETTWDCKNSAGEVLFSGGPYINPLEFIKDTLYLTEDDCYTFAIYDAGGDGLVGGTSGFTLRQHDFSLIYQNNDFANTEELVQFSINQIGLPEQDKVAEFNVYPNPFDDHACVSFNLTEDETINLTIYNVIGKVVYTLQQTQMTAGHQQLRIDTREFVPGIYFVNLKAGEEIFTKKISSF